MQVHRATALADWCFENRRLSGDRTAVLPGLTPSPYRGNITGGALALLSLIVFNDIVALIKLPFIFNNIVALMCSLLFLNGSVRCFGSTLMYSSTVKYGAFLDCSPPSRAETGVRSRTDSRW